MARDADLLKEIREAFDYCVAQWREIREEARLDMRYVSGDPWDPKERKARLAAERPCLSLDELSQYLNQTVNDVRQNKRAIKVVPKGNGADGKTAELRGNLIRQIEYKSNAQAAYATAFQDAVERSYGYFKVVAKYSSPESFEQELCIKRIPNPDMVLLDPDAREADYSDMRLGFLIDTMPVKRFQSQWKNAEIKNFSGEIAELAPAWVRDDRVQIAEYWKVEEAIRTLLLVEDEATPVYLEDQRGAKIDGDYLVTPDGLIRKIANRRKVAVPAVVQYITNGVEILETNPWRGRWIPIIPVMGKELYIDTGAGSKRIIMSLTRLARDAATLYSYVRTCQLENVGMTPKTPFLAYEGQIENNDQRWQMVNRVPQPFLTFKGFVDGMPPGTVLPPPSRQPYDPPIAPLEMLAESAKRAIMSAMGKYNVSVGRSDTQAKSGVAIKALDTQSDQGSFHFIDNYDRALEHAGRILDDLLSVYYGQPRDVGVRKPDESYEVLHINEPYADPKTGEQRELRLDRGDHDVTISTGPSYQSQREEATEFVDLLVQNIQSMPLEPVTKARMLALAVKLKNLGPLGDQMADIIDPSGDEKIPPQALAAMEQMQQQLRLMQQAIQTLIQEKEAKILELESKERQVAIQETTKLTIAEMKVDFERSQAMLRAELEAISQRLDMLNQTGLAAAAAASRPAPEAEVI